MKPNREAFIKSATKGAPLAVVRSKFSSAVVYMWEDHGKAYGLGFFGKAERHSFYYSFKTPERCAEYCAEWMRGRDAVQAMRDQRKAEQKAKLAQGHNLKLGDVLRSSWGYDQTNIDYYEVTRIVGKNMVEVREIAALSESTGDMQGTCTPRKGHYVGEPMRRRVSAHGGVKVSSCANAYKIEPKVVGGIEVYEASHWTAYA